MTNAELIEALQADIREVEDDPVNTLSLMWRAADAIEADDKRIAELEAQLPKEGEWIPIDDGDSIYDKCSVCGKNYYGLLTEIEFLEEYHYCPNCGVRMQTVTDCHTSKDGER